MRPRRRAGWPLLLGLLASAGCSPHATARFCSAATTPEGQSTRLTVRLATDPSVNLSTETGTCSPCTPLPGGDTYLYELVDPSGTFLGSDYKFVDFRTYIFRASRDENNELVFSAARVSPDSFGCARITYGYAFPNN